MLCNEADLAQRASKHDQAAFAELYNAYVEKIYKYIYYKVGNAPDAEDLCEQVFLKAWEAIGRYTWCGYPFSSWLYKLAHNVVVDHYRTRRETMPLDTAFATSDEPVDPDTTLQQMVEAAELRDAINQLTAEQRQVIALKFIEGYENTEIAQMMNKKEGAIRALQYRALRSLQGILEAEEAKMLEFALGLMDARAS
ncbi:MAG TPA: sigma-70 family RNA polymerase sigma factor [Chloroflexia bacterium]|nr:sigma-70 family RNA polymerase sigma factor [Chloroflexia bacterium]